MSKKSSAFSKTILNKIQKENIKPLSPDYFLFINIKKWFVVLLFTAIAGLSLSMLLYFAFEFDFTLLPLFLKTPGKDILIYTVLSWFSVLFLFSYFVFKKYRNTENGYRMESTHLLALIVIVVLSLGGLLYAKHASQYFDQQFSRYLPIYQSWETVKIKIWSQPEKGFLAGKIVSLDSGTRSIRLEDFKGRRWQVDLSNAFIRKKVILSEGSVVKIIGKLSENQFFASELRPWQGKREKGRCYNSKDKEACLKEGR